MNEAKTVTVLDAPNTRASLARDLSRLGLKSGMTVIAHTSLSSLGWVCGGAVAVVQALMDVVTPAGTLVMPAHSSANTEPSLWRNPPVPETWWPVIRESMPAFDPRTTPSAFMGAIAEAFRSFSGVKRSSHPAVSFSAWGRHADQIVENHALEFSLGEKSPLARIYDLDGFVLLLGVGHDCNTSLHLAEARAPGMPEKAEGGAIQIDGHRCWMEYLDYDYDSSDFGEIGRSFEIATPILKAKVGAADARLLNQRPLVDFALAWMKTNRQILPRG